MKKGKEIDELILLRYINNELSDTERMDVEEWINSSESNRKLAEDYYYLSFALSSLRVIKQSDPHKALQKVNKRIKRKQSRRFFIRIQQAAALLLLPVLLFTGYLLLQFQEEDPIFYMETRMTPGMIGSIELPDGTKVWLNSSSYLKYPGTFSGNTREVELDGEAYFEVATNAERPFIVHTENSSVKVLGTEFNIDAYSHNNFVTTTLVEGSVRFSYSNEYNKTGSVLLNPNEQILYDKKTHQACKNETYVPKDIAWKEGQIILKDTPLSEILWILSKRFHVDFDVKDMALYKHSFTGVFTNQQIERVLEHFERSSGIHYKINHISENSEEITKTKIDLY